jgi:hypothetical protein
MHNTHTHTHTHNFHHKFKLSGHTLDIIDAFSNKFNP